MRITLSTLNFSTILHPSEYVSGKIRMWAVLRVHSITLLWDDHESGYNAPICSKNVDGKEMLSFLLVLKEESTKRKAELKAKEAFYSQKTSIRVLGVSMSQNRTMYTIVWRNKPKIETLSLDGLFNNLKAYESEVKGTSKEMDLRWNIAMLTMRARRFLKNTGRKLDMANKERIGFDKSKCDGFGYDWSDQAEEGPTNFALMAYSSTSSTSSTHSEGNPQQDLKDKRVTLTLVDETKNVESVTKHSNDPLLSGKDSLKLNELIELYTNLQKKVLDLETTKTIQALEIDSLKKRVKKLEKKQRSRTYKLRRLYKVSLSAKVIFLDDEASLGNQEDASKQGRKILDIVLVEIEKPVVNATTTTTTTVADEVEMNLAQTLIEIKSAKPKAKGIVMQEPKEQEELTIEEKSKLFQQLLEKRRKFFAAKRAEEKRNIPPTKAQQRSIITELVEGTKREESSKRDETIRQESSSKRVEGVAIDAIPLSTKPPSIIDYKIIKEGKINIYQIIRADGSSKRHGYTRLEEGYERVLWGDLKTMFEHHVEDLVWSTSSTNDVNTANLAYEVSTVSPNINIAYPQVSTANFSDNIVYAFMVENPNGSNLLQQDLEQIHKDDLEAMDFKWQLSLLSMRAKRYFQRTGKKIFINANDTAGYDKSKVECFNCHKIGHFARECKAPRNKEGQFRYQDNTRKQGNNEDTSSKAMLAIDGVGFNWM
ncbi:ribonuclease H-like domain-containing protein [Tanacetum coccineum]